MRYKKVEEYDFRVPNEYKAYLSFRDKLKQMGIRFADQDNKLSSTITILTQGEFEVDDRCDILKMMKNDK